MGNFIEYELCLSKAVPKNLWQRCKTCSVEEHFYSIICLNRPTTGRGSQMVPRACAHFCFLPRSSPSCANVIPSLVCLCLDSSFPPMDFLGRFLPSFSIQVTSSSFFLKKGISAPDPNCKNLHLDFHFMPHLSYLPHFFRYDVHMEVFGSNRASGFRA